MDIKKIKVKNFKNFQDLEVNLNKFNVIIGANAAGKSSFIQIFNFLSNIKQFGLENAVFMQGGIEYLRNINAHIEESMEIELDLETRDKLTDCKYYLNLALIEKDQQVDFKIVDEQLKITYNTKKEKEAKVDLNLSRKQGQLNFSLEKVDSHIFQQEELLTVFKKETINLEKKQSLLETPYPYLFVKELALFFQGIGIYNIEPAQFKAKTAIIAKGELEKDASNLELALKKLMSNPDKKKMFLHLLKDLLPFVENIDLDCFSNKAMLFKLKEKQFQEQYLPASLLSDGTIFIMALLIILYFEKKQVVIIEEPERNIHPHLISRITEMFKEVTKFKQIIVTTHNPEILKYIDLQDLLLVHRQQGKASLLTKPIEKKEVKIFLSNDLGIDDLYIQNLLEV